MKRQSSRDLRRHALRTAALATVLVAAGLAIALTATDLLVSANLTGSVDKRLGDWLSRAGNTGGTSITELAPDQDFDEPLLSWVQRQPGGPCQPVGVAPSLPAGLCGVSSPTTELVAGIPFRLSGRSLPDGEHLVVGGSLAPVAHQIGDLVLAELIVGPLLLVAVFLGAVTVGSRVGGSVERMRLRQLAFTADASHELRTPLTVMQAETGVALAGDDRSLRPALDRVSGEITRMRRIVEDLLWLARFDSEPGPAHPEALDLGTAARLGSDRFATLAAGRSVAVEVDAPETALLMSMPAEWLDRLVGVLVDNACRHARSRVVVGASALPGRRIELSVADDGEGIPEAELRRIFDRFHRATSRGEGAGLGLAIADAIVRATQGRWEVTNRSGGGARFAVSWPWAKGLGPEPAGSRVRPVLPSGRRGSWPPAG